MDCWPGVGASPFQGLSQQLGVEAPAVHKRGWGGTEAVPRGQLVGCDAAKEAIGSLPLGFRIGYSGFQIEKKQWTDKRFGMSYNFETGYRPYIGWYVSGGIGLTLGSEMVAVFGLGTVAGLTNQIAEGSFLLFLANLIGITVTSLVVFLLQRYGSFRSCWRNLLVWLGLLGLLSLPLSSALHDFSVRQQMDAEFGRFKAGQLKRVALARGNQRLWSKVRLMYSSVSVVNNEARLDIVLNAPEDILDQSFMNDVNQQMLKLAKDFGLDDLDVNISVIPNRVYKFDNQSMN